MHITGNKLGGGGIINDMIENLKRTRASERERENVETVLPLTTFEDVFASLMILHVFHLKMKL